MVVSSRRKSKIYCNRDIADFSSIIPLFFDNFAPKHNQITSVIIRAFFLAVGLCMDSFAVSLTSGVLLKPFTLSRVLKIAAFMAVFQGAMPLIGWFLGIGFKNYIEE